MIRSVFVRQNLNNWKHYNLTCLSIRTLGNYTVQHLPVRVATASKITSNLTYDIPFIRTNPKGKTRILALHGTPGSLEDFKCLIEPLEKRIPDLDFIAVTFPDIRFSFKTGEFWHSSEEKLDLLTQFLEKQKLTDLDILVGHSAGSNVQMPLTLYSNINVKSLVTICGTGTKIIPILQPEWFHGTCMPFLKSRLTRPLVIILYEISIRVLKLGKMDAVEACSSLMTLYETEYWAAHKAPKWVDEIKKRDYPRLLIFGAKDRLIPFKHCLNLAQKWGNQYPQNYYIYDGRDQSDVEQVQKPLDDSFPPVVQFNDGGHWTFQQFPDVVAEHISALSRRLKQ